MGFIGKAKKAVWNVGIKLVWKRLEGQMPWIKRWAPVIGSAVLVVATVLRLLGQDEVAGVIETGGHVVGLTPQAPVTATEVAAVGVQIAATGAAAWGVWRKVAAEIAKARTARAALVLGQPLR